jgi:hypothetical protein
MQIYNKEKDMKKINKKILYGMGAISIVASPIIAVVACGAKAAPAPKKPPMAKNTSIVNIDLDKIDSPKDLILKMNESMHFISKAPITKLGVRVPDPIRVDNNDGYPLTKEQYIDIANHVITDATFNFTYKGETEVLTSDFNRSSMVMKRSIDKMLKN